MRFVIVVMVASLSRAIFAQDAGDFSSDVDVAINRGLSFLAKDATEWKRDHQCASCHHAALVVWAMAEAKQRQRTIDEPVLAELTKWIAESGDGKTSVPRPSTAPRALNTKAVYFALALGANPSPDSVSRKGLTQLLTTVKEDQLDDGSWASWPETRPPFFGHSDERMTALATLVMIIADSNDSSLQLVRDKGIRWLNETKTDDDPQSIALRLVLWQRIGRPANELGPLSDRIQQRQNEDGGWSQAPEMPSDSWATGQALYALSHAGIKADTPTVARAHRFLVKTQRENGSWQMTSRPSTLGGAGSNSLVPVTGAGTAWAILGLVRSQ
jgi:hypothetical protein